MIKRKLRRKPKKFNPDSAFIEQATADYLAAGGTITQEEFQFSEHADGYYAMNETGFGEGRRIKAMFPPGFFG